MKIYYWVINLCILAVLSTPVSANTVKDLGSDAVQLHMLEQLVALAEWASGHEIIISSVGVPTDGPDAPVYAELMRVFLAASNQLGFCTSPWAVADDWDDYRLILIRNGEATSVYDQFARNALKETGCSIRSINLSRGEWTYNYDGKREGDTHSYHEDSAIWSTLSDSGFTHVRLYFRLEELFLPTGDFNLSDKARFLKALEAARAAGLKVVLDPHNFAALNLDGVVHVLGGEVFTEVLHNTMMRNLVILAQEVNEKSTVVDAIALMNEPWKVTPQAWEGYAQSAVDVIRGVGFEKEIHVSTGDWQGINSVAWVHPNGPWITDPLDNTVYSLHAFFDTGTDPTLWYSGNYLERYKTYVEILENR